MYRIFTHAAGTSAQKYHVMRLVNNQGWEILETFEYLTDALFYIKSL